MNKLPSYITDLVHFEDVDIVVDEGFICINPLTGRDGVIRWKEPFGCFEGGQVVPNLTFDFQHGEIIVYDEDCERGIVMPFKLAI